MKRRCCAIMWLFSVGIAIVIFVFSSQPASESGKVSGGVTIRILNLLPQLKTMPEHHKIEIAEKLEPFIRKCAHFSLYASLGFCLAAALFLSGARLGKSVGYSYGMGTLYAASDELHQFFVPGRSAQVSDVFLDSVGVIAGCLVLWVLIKILGKRGNIYVQKIHKTHD